jgi:hypothetical protein
MDQARPKLTHRGIRNWRTFLCKVVSAQGKSSAQSLARPLHKGIEGLAWDQHGPQISETSIVSEEYAGFCAEG